jgi:membrane protein DedA with SNARE-associated domain
MALFQGENDSFWLWITVLVTAMMAGAIWFIVLIGREKQFRSGEASVSNGDNADLEGDNAPLPSFLKITFVGTALWALGYLLWTGFRGVTGF